MILIHRLPTIRPILALLCSLAVDFASAQTPSTIPSESLCFAATALPADLYESDQELAINTVIKKGDGSTGPLRDGVAMVKALAPDARTAVGPATAIPLILPSKFCQVNDVMRNILRLASGPKQTPDGSLISVRLIWCLRINGAVVEQFNSYGQCSDIPTYSDVGVTLRYSLLVNLEVKDTKGITRSATPLQIDIIDQNPLYAQTWCWKLDSRRSNVLVKQRQSRSGPSMEEHLKSAVKLANDWVNQFGDDFDDHVIAKLTPKTDQAGKVVFDGMPIQAAARTHSQEKLSWTFTPDSITEFVFAALGN